VNFHLSDVNSHKFGLLDKRCLLEAHPAGRQPLVVTVEAPNVRSAIHAALTKLPERSGASSVPVSKPRMARKLDLHEDAIFRRCGGRDNGF
jgi:hypothetical protein